MRNVILVLINTLRVTFRRRSSLIIYLLLPVGGVLLSLAIMSGTSSYRVRVGIANEDGGTIAAQLSASIETWGDYQTRQVEPSKLEGLISDGSLDCGIIIPQGFSSGLLGQPPGASAARIRLISLKGQSVTAALESLIDQYTSGVAQMAAASAGDPAKLASLLSSAQKNGVALTVENLPDQQTSKGVTDRSIGYLLLFVMLGAGITSQLILAEKRSRTYFRICSAPVLSRQYVAGNGAAGLAIIVAQIILVMVLLRGVLRVEAFGSDLVLIALLIVFGIVAVGLGMLIAAFSRSSGMATALSTLVLTPSCMLSGCFWPLSFMPPFMQKLALFMPPRWVLDGVSKLQAGEAAGGVAINFAVLLAFAAAFLLIAVYGFASRKEAGTFV